MIDIKTLGVVGDGTTDDIAAINAAIVSYNNVLIADGEFLISSSIIVPSNRTVYFKNCTIKLKAASYDNVIRNENQAGNSNIKIIGLGNVCFNQNLTENNDTGAHTTWGISQANSWHYIAVFLCNVTNFEISGITINDYCAWAILIQRCIQGTVKDIRIFVMTSLGNQDGIDVGHGSSYITFNNCKGYCGDDMIAIVSWNGGSFVNRNYMGGDTHHLTFINTTCTNNGANNIRFLAGDRGIIRNISYSNHRYAYGAYSAARFGGSGYPASPPTADELKDITIDGLIIDTITQNVAAIEVEGNCKNITFTNLVNNSGRTLYHKGSGTPENFFINGVQYT